MSLLRFLTAGESHGPKLTAILEGMVAGLPLTSEAIDRELARRQVAYGAGGRMKIERDAARITAGVMGGLTTGAPISLEVANLDYKAWTEKEVPPMTIPRPGHADLTAAIKYGYRDLRLALERASAGDGRPRGRRARSARRTWRSSASRSAVTSRASARLRRPSRTTYPTPSGSPWPRPATCAAPTRPRLTPCAGTSGR